MANWALAIGFGVVTFLSMFMYMAIGMAIGDFEANMFLISVLTFAALIGAGVYWLRRSQKNEP